MCGVPTLLQVVDLVRQMLNRNIPMQQLALFLRVAENPGISMTELSEQLGMPQGSVSRNVKLLTDQRKQGRESRSEHGYGLLCTQQHAVNRHQLTVGLTRKGEEFVAELDSIFAGAAMQQAAARCDCGHASNAHGRSGRQAGGVMPAVGTFRKN